MDEREYQRLRQSEESFRNLAEAFVHGIFVHDEAGVPLYVNRALAQMFGYDAPEQVLALPDFTVLLHEADREHLRIQADERTGSKVTADRFEATGVRCDGTRFPVLNSVRWIQWAGEPALMIAVTDLSELRATERALSETTDLFQLLLDTIPSRVFWKDLEGRFLGCNQRLVADLGLSSPSELVGATDYDVAIREEADAFRRDDAAVCETGEPMLGYEERRTRASGASFWLRTSKTPLRDSSGEIVGVLGTYEDITEQKAAREALLASEERYALAVRGSTDGIWDWDIRRQTIYLSRRLLEILSLARRRKSISPAEIASLLHPDDREGYRVSLLRHLRGETDVFRDEFRVICDDGSVRWVLDRGVALRDANGRAYRMAGSVVDITEQRRSHEELARYRTKLEGLVAARTEELRSTQASLLRAERLATLGELTAAVSHELRNPLGTIHTSLQTLRRRLETQDGASQRALARIERSIARCVLVIDELLAYARIGAPICTRVEIDAWVADAIAHATNTPGVEHRAGAAARVSIDVQQLGLALGNVLRNAMQALAETGPQPRSPSIRIETSREGDRVELRVVDWGPGIEPEARESIFEPLFSTRNFGVGLGLPVARQILEGHGGGVEIAETGPGGTTVLLWLPAATN